MAIKKQKESKAGLTGEYWSIKSITIDKANKQSSAVLMLHKDADAKKVQGKSSMPGEDKFYSWNGVKFPFSVEALDAKDPYKIAYEKILADDKFFKDCPSV